MNWIAHALGIVTSTVALPGWIVLAGAVLGAIFVFLLLVRSDPNDNPLTILVLIGIFLGSMGVGTAVLREVTGSHITTEANELEIRAAELDKAAAQAGLGCLNADESLVASCEVDVFERPDTVAAARGLTRARLALIEDAFTFVRQRNATALLDRVAVWRLPLERDPYGIVASVLLEQRGCTPGSCPQLGVIGRADRISANMAEDRYGKLVAKYAPNWERVARNRGVLAQPQRTGPFGFAIVDHKNGASPAEAQPVEPPGSAGDTPPVVNLPVENAEPTASAQPPVAAEAPLPPARPAVTPPATVQQRPTTRPLVPRTPPARTTPPTAGNPAAAEPETTPETAPQATPDPFTLRTQ